MQNLRRIAGDFATGSGCGPVILCRKAWRKTFVNISRSNGVIAFNFRCKSGGSGGNPMSGCRANVPPYGLNGTRTGVTPGACLQVGVYEGACLDGGVKDLLRSSLTGIEFSTGRGP